MEATAKLRAEIAACQLCAPEFATTATGHSPAPVVWFRSEARILVAGQAPGIRVHQNRVPFQDPSGARLRDWMAVTEAEFYDQDRIAIVPMAFCFPGYDAQGADLPPPPRCAQTWHAAVMTQLSAVKLRLLIGGAAQKWHLGARASVTQTVETWRSFGPDCFPLPHPSWRNSGWLKRHTWFETDLLPELRRRIREVLSDGPT